MKILVACEFSGIVRDAFIKAGHDAISCDLLPTERPGPHYQGDVFHFLSINPGKFDMMLAFPPCTYLCSSGSRWLTNNPTRQQQQVDALNFVRQLMSADIPKICIENPIGAISPNIRRPDQYIQPYEFGDPVSKRTCLWLKGLPSLKKTKIVDPEYHIDKNGKKYSKLAWMSPGKNRSKIRSTTFKGIADAMANQWG